MIQISELSKDDYVALGRFLLGTGPVPECLSSAIPKSFTEWRKFFGEIGGQRETGAVVGLVALGMYLRFRNDVRAEKPPFSSTDAAMLAEFEADVLSVLLPLLPSRIAKDSTGDVAGLSRDVATAIEVAEAFPGSSDNREAWWEWLRRAGKAFPSVPDVVPKGQKRTKRLHKVLLLFDFGFDRLTEIERYEVFERIGLTETEIPSGDAMRKLLSYYRLARRRALRGAESKSPAENGGKTSN